MSEADTMDDLLVFGLGALDSPEDPRDWPAERLAAAAGADPDAALPVQWMAPLPYPAVHSQGVTPQCVAYASASVKGWQDARDADGMFPPDFALFFARIGGTAQGAHPRAAMAEMLASGYPVRGAAPAEALRHRIAAYARAETTREGVCGAMLALGGPVLLSLDWARSWFRPVAGVLPAWDQSAGGHSIMCAGWDEVGLVLVNSWGSAWGAGGRCVLPWSQLGHAKECWQATDHHSPPPSYTLRIARGATVQSARLLPSGSLGPWTLSGPMSRTTARDCKAPERRRAASGRMATVALATEHAFAGRFVHLGQGVSVVRA